MQRDEILRRFRLVLIGYTIVAVTLVVGLAIDWRQTQKIRDTQQALIHDTEQLARAIANGQTYLCDQIARLGGEHEIRIHCLTQQQRFQQIINRLTVH